MKPEKICICPICGGRYLVFWVSGEVECIECGKEVIPLATPQIREVRDAKIRANK